MMSLGGFSSGHRDLHLLRQQTGSQPADITQLTSDQALRGTIYRETNHAPCFTSWRFVSEMINPCAGEKIVLISSLPVAPQYLSKKIKPNKQRKCRGYSNIPNANIFWICDEKHQFYCESDCKLFQ
ncbi:MAG: hypothetical protein P8Q92_12770 [Pseudoprimorskyibacter sp.]|nr:hypothetical protein [Pseudoprimorskyibacter sp.]